MERRDVALAYLELWRGALRARSARPSAAFGRLRRLTWLPWARRQVRDRRWRGKRRPFRARDLLPFQIFSRSYAFFPPNSCNIGIPGKLISYFPWLTHLTDHESEHDDSDEFMYQTRTKLDTKIPGLKYKMAKREIVVRRYLLRFRYSIENWVACEARFFYYSD